MRGGIMRIGERAMLGALLTALWAAPAGAAATASFSPNWVEGHHAFTLALTGESGMCVPEFSHQETYVSGGVLVLSMLERQRPGFMCTNAASWPYRTEFTAPGLDSGNYPVKVRWRKACEFDPAPCPAGVDTQTVGNLRVTDSAALTYHIGPRSVPAGRASELSLSGPFGCGDGISGMSVDTARPSIVLSLTVERQGFQCDTLVPGIRFQLPPLESGIWQVYAAPSLYCAPGTVCTYLRIAPQLAGALEVQAAALSLPAPSRRPRSLPVESGRTGFRADWSGAPRDAAGRLVPVPRDAAGRPAAGPSDASERNLPGGKP